MKRLLAALPIFLALAFAFGQNQAWNASLFASILANDIDGALAPCEVQVEGFSCVRTWGDLDLVSTEISYELGSYTDVMPHGPWIYEDDGILTRQYGILDDDNDYRHAFLLILSPSYDDEFYTYVNIAKLGILGPDGELIE